MIPLSIYHDLSFPICFTFIEAKGNLCRWNKPTPFEKMNKLKTFLRKLKCGLRNFRYIGINIFNALSELCFYQAWFEFYIVRMG